MKKTTFIMIGSLFTICTILLACGRNSIETQAIRKNVTETVFASGTLELDEEYNLKAKTDGYLQEVHFEEGDLVTQNQTLATINNTPNTINAQAAQALLKLASIDTSSNAPALKQLSANIDLAKDKLQQEETQYNRYKKLYEQKSVSKLEYENSTLAYQTAQSNLRALEQNYILLKKQAKQQWIAQEAQSRANNDAQTNNTIKAIIGGKIYKKLKQNGDFVNKGEIIATIGNEKSIYAKLNVDESNITKVKIGQKVVIQLNTDTNQTYDAIVTEILPTFDATSQSFACKAAFVNPINFKITSTQLQVNIILGVKNKALLIPKNFLQYGNKVLLKNKTFRTVQTGIISNQWVEITKGLNEQDVIIEEL